MKPKRTRARSAKTGRIVTRKYAKRHPATTVVETVVMREKQAAKILAMVDALRKSLVDLGLIRRRKVLRK